jgi:hypothetical protein
MFSSEMLGKYATTAGCAVAIPLPSAVLRLAERVRRRGVGAACGTVGVSAGDAGERGVGVLALLPVGAGSGRGGALLARMNARMSAAGRVTGILWPGLTASRYPDVQLDSAAMV